MKFIVPSDVSIHTVNELPDSGVRPVPVVVDLVLQSAQESFAGGVVRRAALRGHRPCALHLIHSRDRSRNR
jgi:hypothetical protein